MMEKLKIADSDLWDRQYKLIALDIDGTLINSRQLVTGRTRRAIEAAKAEGIMVTIATGRHFNSALPIARSAGINAPLVCNDGAFIKDIFSGETLATHLLPLDIAHGVLDIAKDYGSFRLQIFTTGNKMYAGKNYRMDMAKRFIRSRSRRRYTFWGIYNYFNSFVFVPVTNTGDIEGAKNALLKPPAKLVVYGSADELKEFIERVTAKFDGKISLTTAIPDCIDVLHNGVSKAKGLGELTQRLNILPEEVISIGDNINDLEMMEFAGIGVAMGNALEEVKEKADYITKSNEEEGVAYFIEKLLEAKSRRIR